MESIIDIKPEVEKLFSKYHETVIGEITKRGVVCSQVNRKKVLFVGMNPSYLNDSKPESYSYNVNDAITGYSKHYKKFYDLAVNSGIGQDWTYLDIFYFRETDQNKVFSMQSHSVWIDFLCEQLRLTQDIIEDLCPELIVVCNSGAKIFLGKDVSIDKNGIDEHIWLGYQFEFNENLGVDLISNINPKSIGKTVSNIIGVPVIFTPTLTYMEKSTRNRLEWHIRHILRMKNKSSC